MMRADILIVADRCCGSLYTWFFGYDIYDLSLSLLELDPKLLQFHGKPINASTFVNAILSIHVPTLSSTCCTAQVCAYASLPVKFLGVVGAGPKVFTSNK